MIHRLLPTACTLVLASVFSMAAEAPVFDPVDGVGHRASVTRGIVFAVDLPDVAVLEDGTVVELAPGTSWSGTDGPASVFPGDELLVVGERHDVGGTAMISASGVQTVRRAGRRLSPGGVVCPQEKSTGPLTAAAGRRFHSEDEETRLEGAVLSLASDGFGLRTDDGHEYWIAVTVDTELRDIGALTDLAVGDRVSVRGVLDGTVLTATRVELLDAFFLAGRARPR